MSDVFSISNCPFAPAAVLETLRQHCVGRPVFSPDPGCGGGDEWACHVVDELASNPSLVEDVVNGRIEFFGQPLTDLAPLEFKLARYPGPVSQEHLLEDVEEAMRSYNCCWLRSADFPAKKPPWALITDEQYEELKNDIYKRPTLSGGTLLEVDGYADSKDGFYNAKHLILHSFMLGLEA